jgi:hypothetical protein
MASADSVDVPAYLGMSDVAFDAAPAAGLLWCLSTDPDALAPAVSISFDCDSFLDSDSAAQYLPLDPGGNLLVAQDFLHHISIPDDQFSFDWQSDPLP